MNAIISSVFCIIMFTHKRNIIKIDQLTYFTSDPATTNSIQHVGKSIFPYQDIGVGLLKDSCLLGNFSFPSPNIPPPIANIRTITSSTISFDDPWIVPSDSTLDSFDGTMPLSPFEITYQAIQSFSDTPSTECDPVNVINEDSLSISSSASTSIPDTVQ